MGTVKVRLYSENEKEVHDLIKLLKMSYKRVTVQGVFKNLRDPFVGWYRGVAEVWLDDKEKQPFDS